MKSKVSTSSNEFSKQMQSAIQVSQDTSYVRLHRVIVMNDRIIVRKESSGIKNHQYNEKSLENLQDNNVKGKLSKQSYLHIRKHLVAWLECVQTMNNSYSRVNLKHRRKLVLITLTLSAKQLHSDLDIKRHLFSRFIDYLRNETDMMYYFIRYESQENGNIHAHIITDTYIDKKILQRKWNMIQNRLGYVDRFKQKFGHDNPPSTDIRVMTTSHDAINYLLGYVMKKSKNREISGRQYGMSDRLKEMDLYSEIVDSTWNEVLSKLDNDKDVFKHIEDFYCVYVFDFDLIQKYSLSWLYQDKRDYYLQMYRRFYLNLGYEN